MIYPCDDGCQCGQEICISNNSLPVHSPVREWVGFPVLACDYCGQRWPCEYVNLRPRFSYFGLFVLLSAFALMLAVAQAISWLVEEALS
jgi:hypothetical protein